MKFGLMLPNKGHPYGDANLLVELAVIAEQAGWEGFFLWDHIGGGGNSPTMDPWICLGAIASQTLACVLEPWSPHWPSAGLGRWLVSS
jgi:hypothetical protein